jgi:hypothetical protein
MTIEMNEDRPNGPAELAAEFERQRPCLRAVALRMLGVDADAEDAIQRPGFGSAEPEVTGSPTSARG